MICSLLAATARAADGTGTGSASNSDRDAENVARPATSDATSAGLAPNRSELTPVPVVSGNSDVGLQLGVAAAYVRFRERHYPYLSRLDGLLSSSFKSDVRGLRAVQHHYAIRFDHPQLLSPRLRLDARADFLRAVDYTWFGIGNATVRDPRSAPAEAASANQYVERNVRASVLLRIKTGTPFDLALVSHTRYALPDPYPGSRLADDLASGAVSGGKAAFLQTAAAGFIVDTRDSEFVPTRGIFYQVGVSGTLGSAESVRFGEASATLSHYARLGGPFLFASRMIASFKVGEVPFYELQQGGVFSPQYLVGGAAGIRGVRLGRYAGPVKAISTTEIRVLPFPRFRFLGRSLRIGATAFFDAGRVWSDYGFRPSLDGRTLGLKYGIGGGLFFQADEATVFRLEAAYSDDDADRDFPVAIYLQSGLQF